MKLFVIAFVLVCVSLLMVVKYEPYTHCNWKVAEWCQDHSPATYYLSVSYLDNNAPTSYAKICDKRINGHKAVVYLLNKDGAIVNHIYDRDGAWGKCYDKVFDRTFAGHVTWDGDFGTPSEH